MSPLFASLKKHRILSRPMSRASVEDSHEPVESRGRRASSVETSIRIPKINGMALGNPMSNAGENEPLIEDFHTHYVQPVSHHQRKHNQHSMAISVADQADDLPGSADFLEDEDEGYDDEEESPAPPDFSSHGKHLTLPKQSSAYSQPPNVSMYRGNKPQRNMRDSGSHSVNKPLEIRERASIDSGYSQETAAASVHTLPPMQMHSYVDEGDRLQPLLEDDPSNFDLVAAPEEEVGAFHPLEERGEQLFTREHLEHIFADRKSLLKFTSFLHEYRSQSIPILIFYLDALKALRAIEYANAVAEALDPIPGYAFTDDAPQRSRNGDLQKKADQAFDVLVRDDLPAYITHTWIQVASVSIQKRITGTLAPHLREASEGLAEVFCLSDPSRKDNPIVFASEEFSRTTQYGMSYSIGRNCRFLQGPKTNPHSVRRLAEACKASREHSEVFVNYRRDGSPFMNLLMIAPLYDSTGTLRYFIGAQVDVSGLLGDATDLEAFANLAQKKQAYKKMQNGDDQDNKDEFRSLNEMFNTSELESVRQYGGSMHRDQVDESDRDSVASNRPRLLIKDHTSEFLQRTPRSSHSIGAANMHGRENGKLEGVYQNYLLVRPAPSLRILFTSPSLRVPGILQSPFLDRIGGSPHVRSELAQAFSQGRGVTAKIRWLTRVSADGEDEGRSRWIHCTPLLGHTGAVGVWMIVLVDDEGGNAGRRFRQAPQISRVIGGKHYDHRAVQEKNEQDRTKMERMLSEQRGGGRDSSRARSTGRQSGSTAMSQTGRQGSVFSGANGNGSTSSFELGERGRRYA